MLVVFSRFDILGCTFECPQLIDFVEEQIHLELLLLELQDTTILLNVLGLWREEHKIIRNRYSQKCGCAILG